MRILNDNLLTIDNTIFSSSDNNDSIENIFDNDIDYIGKFDTNTNATIETTFTELKKINCVSIFNTNADKIIFGFIKEDDSVDAYMLEKKENRNVFNIQDVLCKKIIIKLYGNSKEKLYIGFLMIGLAIDFPPHSLSKSHKINYTREQFFSQSGKYFCRRIPFKSYDEWSVNFDFLNSKNKKLILDFLNHNNNNSFVLQVWKEGNKQKYNNGNVSVYEISEYGNGVYANTSNKKISTQVQKVVHEMKAGLYVITNNTIEFKKTQNKVYPWSVTINFREVK